MLSLSLLPKLTLLLSLLIPPVIAQSSDVQRYSRLLDDPCQDPISSFLIQNMATLFPGARFE